MENKRATWGSTFGFLMAAVGSAVGLGNIWGFPYKMGANGGFAFLVLYLILAIFVGFIAMVAELALGRKTGRIAVGYTADLILVDFRKPNNFPCHDVVENLVYASHGSNVTMNMARGRVIYKDGVFCTIDMEQVKKEVREYALPLVFGK